MNRLSMMKAGISRRQFMHAVGLSAVAVGASGLLTACSEVDDAASDDAALATETDDADDAVEMTDDAPDDTDEPVGDADDSGDDHDADDDSVDDADDEREADGDDNRPGVVLGVNGVPPTLDPTTNVTLIGYQTQYSIFDMLIRRDWVDSDPPGFGSALVGGLAEDWEFVEDTALEFRLREDVTWHNGDHFTADDVMFTYQRILDQEMAELATAASDFVTVSHLERVDDYTVRFITHEPDPLLEMRVAVRVGWVLPKDYYEEVGQEAFAMEPVGSGPYKVVEFTPEERIYCEAHDDYFMGRPVASSMEFRVIPEVAARVSALVSGEVDIITNISPDQWETLEESEGVRPVGVESLSMHVLRLNSNHSNLSDKRIRQAMSYAIDRQLLVDSLWSGRGTPSHGHQYSDFPDDIFFEEFDLPYDPDRATELLEEAEYDGAEIVYRAHPSRYTLGPELAQAVVAMWNDVGINARVEMTEEHQALEDDNMLHHVTNASNMADPAGSQWTTWGAGSATQEYFWPAPDEYNELGLEQAMTQDRERRVEIWHRMNEIWMDEMPGLPIYTPVEVYGVRDGLEWNPYGILYMDLRNYNLDFTSNDD